MLTEDYVSFETAKLLEDKGFDESCDWSYSSNGTIFHHNGGTNSYFRSVNSQLLHVSRPTLQMAMKWLREVHKIHIIIEPLVVGNYVIYMYHNSHKECLGTDMTYEKAADAAIKYCLINLI